MSWLDSDIPDDRSDLVNPHYTGIELRCTEAGLAYTASVPFFSIRVYRRDKSAEFQIEFRGKDDRYPGIDRALLFGGYTLESVEKRIIQAVNRPSLLHKARIDSRGSSGRGRSRNTYWPDRPDRDAPPDLLNWMEVRPGYIYRLVSRDYYVGVWRSTLRDNFSITFWRYDDPPYDRKAVKFEALDTMTSVEDHVLQAIANPSAWLQFDG
jgi:hypothetical protein